MTLFVSRRFWWEKDGVFTKAQRERLRAVSLSRIICDNSHVARVPADPFSHTGKVEDTVPCSHPLIPHLDLQPWKEPDSGEDDRHGSGPVCHSDRLSLRLPFQIPAVVPFPEFHLGTGCCATRRFCTGVRWASDSRDLRGPAVTQSASSGAPVPRRAQVQMEASKMCSKAATKPKSKYFSPSFFFLSADINECEEQISTCPENSECLNVPGSFTCSGWCRTFGRALWMHPCIYSVTFCRWRIQNPRRRRPPPWSAP